MDIRIAVLGSANFIDRLKEFEHELVSTRLDYYIYQSPVDATEIVKNIKPCDVVFFSGSLPYIFAKDAIESLPIPAHYLKQDETVITTTLLSVYFSQHIPVEQLSIDLIEPLLIQNVLEDIGLSEQYPHLLKIDPTYELEEVANFHASLYNGGITSLAITSIHAVFHTLQDKKVPVIRMLDSKSNILKGLEDAKSLALLAKSRSAKVAIGYIQANQVISEEILKKIAGTIQANYVPTDDYLYTFISTQGNVQIALESNIIEHWFELVSFPIKIAFGYGKTVIEATQNAKDALPYVTENSAYLINDHKELLGPYPNRQQQVQLKTNNPKLVQIAKNTKLSPANLSKIMQFSRSHSSVEFTAYDLEVYLQVSRRTTERLLKKLVDHGYARVVGEEMTYQQGRPRAIYEFNFPTY
ncbi:hypothetical protein [Psychrobacillus lasiicapitis]|uniref:Transcriptional regulator n=1 Tax=Psychrobacillus lasiicapitis TaxID=1636719 RepID=A0A544T6H5_9BACI|nr:hypothetical protein [Psychrobacillus lasiicapitis]TQR13056.1 hypothetical protein FG382_11005 [Psychrobacillus lasiicapitis]GGA34837.1 hypothetical protein GCM10011384_25760 [Psychrobacillus lasiicapitis]